MLWIYSVTFLLLVVVVEAEKRKVVSIDSKVDPGFLLQPPLFGTIHGTGTVNLADLKFDIDSGSSNNDDDANPEMYMVTAVVAKLPHRPTAEEMSMYATNDQKRQEFLAQQGIGDWGTDGTYYGCCNQAALEFSACHNTSALGSVILSEDKKIFKRGIYPLANTSISDMGFERVIWVMNSQNVVLVFGNCHQDASNTTLPATFHIHGTVTFLSFVSTITLPLYLGLTLCHVWLCLWYRHLMTKHSESRIPVEDWIFYTLAFSAVAISVHTVQYTAQAFSDNDWLGLRVISQSTKAMSHAVSRCLYLLLAMGVGVTTPTVNSNCIRVVIGLLLGIFLFIDIIDDLYDIIGPEKTPFLETVINLQVYLGLILWIWIPVEIRRTIRYLNFRNETHKVERYEWIWKIFLLATALTVLQYSLLIFDATHNAGRGFNYMNLIELSDMIYLIILTCIAYLWQPNPSQLMYSYQLLDDTGEFPTHNLSLELSEEGFNTVGEKEAPPPATE